MSTKFKIMKIGTSARNELIKGANFLADAVASTVGPFGANFFLEKGNKITNDGATIAREIELKNEIQHRGVVALREATLKANDEVGDGSTSTTILAQAILKEAVRFLGDDEKGIHGKKTPSEIIRQIESERKEVTEKLIAMSTPITTEAQLISSALVSVEDEELGKLIGSAQWELGKNGILIAEDTAERTSSFEKVKGLRIDNGFGTSFMINNHEKQTLEIENCGVIMTNHTLQNLLPVKKVIDQYIKGGINRIVIIARAFTEQAIKDCAENINRGGVFIYPINAPYTDQVEIMKDLASVLGGNFFHYEDRSLEDIQASDLGFAEKIIAKRYEAIITGSDDEKSQARIDNRIAELEAKYSGSVSEFEKRGLGERIAQLKSGFGIVKIGAQSDVERARIKDKADDAVNAVRAAYQEGVVAGAGLAFKEISEGLPETYILKRPLLSIYQQIMVRAPKDFVIEDWVKDPVKVLRIALEKACSVAGSFATAEGATATERDKPMYAPNTTIEVSDEE